MAIDIGSLLSHALLLRSQSKSLERITVTELLNETGVGRRTFYNYFRDKSDLIAWTYEEKILKPCLTGEDNMDCVFETPVYYENLLQYKDFVMQACKINEQNSLQSSMFEIAKSYLEERISHLSSDALTQERRMEIHYHATAMTQCCVDWINAGMKIDPQEMARMLKKARNNALRDIYDTSSDI